MSPFSKIASAAALFTIALGNPASAGFIRSDLIEDSLTCISGPDCFAFQSFIGQSMLTFTYSHAITYHYEPPGPGTGDTDFSLIFHGSDFPNFPLSSGYAFVDISGLFSIRAADAFSGFRFDGSSPFLNEVDSDGGIMGCSSGVCSYTAHVVSTPVSEPSGIALLGTAIGLFAFLGLSRGRKRVYG